MRRAIPFQPRPCQAKTERSRTNLQGIDRRKEPVPENGTLRNRDRITRLCRSWPALSQKVTLGFWNHNNPISAVMMETVSPVLLGIEA